MRLRLAALLLIETTSFALAQPSAADKAADAQRVADAQVRVCEQLVDCRNAKFRYGKILTYQGNSAACGEVAFGKNTDGDPDYQVWIVLIGILTPAMLESSYPQSTREKIHAGPCSQATPDQVPAPTLPTTAADQKNGHEYDFRGAKLGMPLDEFRTLRFPDAATTSQQSVNADNTIGGIPTIWGVALFCSSQHYKDAPELRLEDYEIDAGEIKCAYYQYLLGTWMQATLAIGTSGYSTMPSYYFIRDPLDQIPRLYSINAITNNNAAANALEGLKEKFGLPTKYVSNTVQNAMGASFPHISASWKSPLSTIQFEAPYNEIDKMAIIYTENRLFSYAHSAEEKAKGSSGGKM
ncbi:MAG TPA: hypothetical protein VHX61_05130 [Rhizomicrobium sp.]|jgi:hypothetical protein|nr:hypothetical protein [Rhizomicrobium sp.]